MNLEIRGQTGVSPVVAVILLVAVTVVLSTTVYVAIGGILGDQNSSNSNAAVKASDDGSVTLISSESGDEVLIKNEDGDEVGSLDSPGATENLDPGEYVIVVQNDGDERVVQRVSVPERDGDNTHDTAPSETDGTSLAAVHDGMDGAGTSDDPYVITNDHELQAMAEKPGEHYVLGNDINASATQHWNDGAGFTPVGDGSPEFTGSFNGDGYQITNLTINRPDSDYVALFGRVDGSASLQDATLVNVDITGYKGVGGLAGRNYASIDNATVTGVVTGNDQHVGGVVGWNRAGIKSSQSTATVESHGRKVGGLVGYQYSGTIRNSSATGDVTGHSYETGGLVGYSGGNVVNSFATGDVNGDDHVGGLTGKSSGIVNSYATGAVSGSKNVGGLAGQASGEVRASYATGAVNGGYYVGGLVGIYYSGDVEASYAAGPVSSSDCCGREGGLIGVARDGTVNTTHWDTETTGFDTAIGQNEGATLENTTGLTTSEMQGAAAETNMFTDYEWDNMWTPVVDPDDYPELQD